MNWTPKDLDDLALALADGRLDEDHHNDFKRELASGMGKRKGNIKLARSVAAMALDGGRLWIGVDGHDTDDDQEPEVTPVTLTGLAERVEQIAKTIPSPPVEVRFREIGAQSAGVLIVEVPWSADGPHMVEGTYYGRGQKRNEPLSDIQVRDALARRQRVAVDAMTVVQEALKPDPIGTWSAGGNQALDHAGEPYSTARLVVVARPQVPKSPTALLDAADGDLGAWLRKRVGAPPGGWPGSTIDDPWYRRTSVSRVVSRVGGVGVAGSPLSPDGRYIEGDVADLYDAIDVSVTEFGAVRIYRGNVAQGQVLMPHELLGFVYHGLRLAREARDSAVLHGRWVLGFALLGASSASASAPVTTGRPRHSPTVAQDPYMAARLEPAESLDDARKLVMRLCGELGRGLNMSVDVDEVTYWGG